MSLHFFNPLMLLGLAGLALPVLVHLLNRRRCDVVEWGAMQFLELGRTRKRRLRLEQLLLLVLRLGLIAFIVLALARPWTRGGLFSAGGTGPARDVVFVVDGSYSMAWEGDGVTPHAQAVGAIHRFLEELQPQDTVSLIDARETPRTVIALPTHDFAEVRAQLSRLQSPTGTTNMPLAASLAARILEKTTNPVREIIVLSDAQARGWSADDDVSWTRFDVLRDQAVVRPQLYVVDVGPTANATLINHHVEQLELSREVTVAEFPVRIRTRVICSQTETPVARKVYFEVDRQRLAGQTQQVQLTAGQEANVEFEHRFRETGSHLVSVVLDADALFADNRADAVVTVVRSIPLLLVDGSPQLDPVRSEVYFATAALSARENETPWVRAKVIAATELNAAALTQIEVVILANVAKITAEQGAALSKFVSGGGGLLIAPGDAVDAASYRANLYRKGEGPLPVPLGKIAARETHADGLHVSPKSLEAPWLATVRDSDGGFLDARFTKWWKIAPSETLLASRQNATVAARFENDDPFLISSQMGLGRVILLAAPLDADWSTLPAKSDYVPFLHEMIFHLAAGQTRRNVNVGEPLVLPLPTGADAKHYSIIGPDGTPLEPAQAGGEPRLVAQMVDTRIPGIYQFEQKQEAGEKPAASRPEFFVVNCDRRESDLRRLNDEERTLLAANDRLTFVSDIDDVKGAAPRDDTPTEYWRMLLFAFVGILLCESLLTRHLVKGGHAVIEEPAPGTNASPEEP